MPLLSKMILEKLLHNTLFLFFNQSCLQPFPLVFLDKTALQSNRDRFKKRFLWFRRELETKHLGTKKTNWPEPRKEMWCRWVLDFFHWSSSLWCQSVKTSHNAATNKPLLLGKRTDDNKPLLFIFGKWDNICD